MVYRIYWAFLKFLRRVLHFEGRLICRILAKLMNIYPYFWFVLSLGRLIRADIR